MHRLAQPCIKDRRGGVRTKFHHVIDVVPILRPGRYPALQTVDGIAQRPIEGVSMAHLPSTRPPSATRCKTQYFEIVSTVDLSRRLSQPAPRRRRRRELDASSSTSGAVQPGRGLLANDPPPKMPDKREELQKVLSQEAAKYNVPTTASSRG
jgi:arylsulfatase